MEPRKSFNSILGSLTGTRSDAPTNYKGLLRSRHEHLTKAEAVLKTAEAAQRPMTTAENEIFTAAMAEVETLNPQIAKVQGMNTYKPQFSGDNWTNPQAPSLPGTLPAGLLKDAESFIHGNMIEAATFQEGSGEASYVVPAREVEQLRQATPTADPFAEAGADIQSYPDFAFPKTRVPWILPGTDVQVFGEGAGPSSGQEASIKYLDIDPSKYTFLTKLSEEIEADMPDLSNGISTEGLRRVFSSTSKALTAALIASLTAASAVTTAGSDNLESLLDLEASVDPIFASPSNVFMGSRSVLSKMRNTRDLQDRPLFDATARTLLGYRFIVNDACGGHLAFGNFRAGAIIRYSAFVILRLNQLYSESGLIGIKFLRRAGGSFFSDASSGTVQPLFLLSEDFGS